ncbi:MAG: BREX-1 system adenine-specific DNA-methyltransferase PglX [Kiritimatiellae bacterium]|nr:BREX-1 system adenine-specific DNA-methyltransferase PglX [Kiritimatiellia bacterium]
MSDSQTNKAEQGMEKYFFRASADDFKKIPGSPIAYWVSSKILELFVKEKSLGEKTIARQGLATGDNNTFARLWYEVAAEKFYPKAQSCEETSTLPYKWFPYNKGGQFKKWFGNIVYVVNWENDGVLIRQFRDETGKLRSRPQNTECYFQKGLTWSDVTSGYLSSRYLPSGNIYDISGHSAFPSGEKERLCILAYMNTTFCKRLAKILNPTMHFQIGDYCNLPFPSKFISATIEDNANKCVNLGRIDWDSYETSWNFTSLALIQVDSGHWPVTSKENTENTLTTSHWPATRLISDAYTNLRRHWQEMTYEMQRLEEENNRIFIAAYGLQDELTPEVPLKEITLTCNPYYRYGSEACEEGSEKWKDLEARLLQDTMQELISYAVGCMFGRYSLDKPGLVLANQGETLEDYLAKVEMPLEALQFEPDGNNVIPMLEGEWFADDITERFKQFLKVTFGAEHYEENLLFVEKSLNVKGRRSYSIRDYFLREFYNDHVRRYKKRPVYWLFSSPKGSFNALIYMHRYRPDTVSVVLNDYLREFRTKLTSYKTHLEAVSISAGASQGEKTKALKEIEKNTKIIGELVEYERDVLYPLATEQKEIDLDDGVKVNYPKFGAALRKIPGLEAKED